MRYLESKEERGRTRKLWEEIFPEDSEAFLDYYYTEKTGTNEILADEAGGEIVSMVRYEVGEGLEKRNDNFAEEVMNQIK